MGEMKMRITVRKVFAALVVIFILSSLAITVSLSKKAATESINYDNEHIQGNIYLKKIAHECDNQYSENKIEHISQFHDIVYGKQGFCNVEERYFQENQNTIQPLNASVSNRNTCNSISSAHGRGRENGYNSLFLSTGCCNYSGYSYTYGSHNIPYYINTSTMTSTLANNIRAQAELWNDAVMHDGTGQIVNLYEVNHTNKINGLPVVVVSREDMSDYAGLFYPSKTSPKIEVSASSMNVDTPVHEFGHLLGLHDLDSHSSIISGTHEVLMGYSRGTTTATLDKAIKYQDIQGIAVMSNRHTEHRFDRFVIRDGKYVHLCFYCDILDSRSTIISGSELMATASTCAHNYELMVSHRSRRWYKCTKCYKVVENPVEYKITLDIGYGGMKDETTVLYGAQVQASYAPSRTHYEFDGYYSEPNGKGICYVKSAVKQLDENFYSLEPVSTNNGWKKSGDGTLYANWKLLSVDYTYEVISIGSGYLPTRTVRITSGQPVTLYGTPDSGHVFVRWTINGMSYSTQNLTHTFTLHRSYTTGKITIYNPNFSGSATYSDGSMHLSLQKNARSTISSVANDEGDFG